MKITTLHLQASLRPTLEALQAILRKLTHGQPSLVGCTEDVLINGEWVLPQIRNAAWLTFQNVDIGCLREPQCNPNPCHSGGHCTDRWRDFSCTCERPYLGHTCQYNYTAATFGYENITNSLVTVHVADYARRAVRSIVDLSMFIRTRQPKGQIFYLGSGLLANYQSSTIDDTCISAQLESGELYVQIQFNGPAEGYTVGGVKLDNGYNHLIEVIRNVTLVQVKLNGTEYFRKTIAATGTLDAQVLYLGGQPQSRSVRQTNENLITDKLDSTPPTAPASITTVLSNTPFKGIIQDVQISNGSSTMIVEFYPLQAPDLDIPPSFGSVSFDRATVLQGVRSDDSCRINPCYHNGISENTWNDYRCICTRGFKGKDCNELEFCELEGCPVGSECKNLEDGYECIVNSTFNGLQAPLQYHLTIFPTSVNNFFFNSLELSYRTRSWGTVLYGKHIDNYFVVFIYHNEVVVEWNFNGQVTTKRFRKDRFEGQWISLLFVFKDPVLRGGFRENVVDESPNFEVIDFDISTFTEILKTVGEYFSEDVLLYKVDQDKKTDNFKGCLGEIRIGGLLLPYFPTKEIYPNQTYAEEIFELDVSSKLDYGCILCYNADCFNQGFCINSTETYKCNCQPGYSADDCSIDINECENNQCQNNAACIDMVAKYECECLPGHGGTCNDLIGMFKCDCPEDFVGKQCEAPLLITCENKPCREGATCETGPNEQTGNNFTCLCTEGMEGPLCDTPFCLRKHCDQGHCNTTGEVPYCEYQRGFEGKFCEVNIDECISPTGGSPCQNGGVCIDGIYSYDCNCTETGYTGLLCEMDVDECKTDRMACGRAGTCENMPGSYRCICDSIKGKCGHQCMAIPVNIARSKRATRGTYSPSAQEFCNPRVELDHVLKPPPEERLI
ncbi:hypothetical protein NQ314_000062 [Rhamnusium bicolor]|uniref:Uncharacterized protein n=1 Tax=Rhamnusium bicolor TaxID=1586634 RepID=A0AAV8ZZG1_9CUCU|nr:hypothetical protein NQ314_000062 [Rhamnusium bicolor]